MISRIKHSNIKLFFKTTSVLVLVCFFATTIIPSQALAQGVLGLPAVGSYVPLSPGFTPTLVRGIKVYPDNPLKFDFIIDSGDLPAGRQVPNMEELKQESEKLIRYFLASLTIPEDELWVNLSPYEKDRIVPDTLGKTGLGIDMLSQDYLLKQITASLLEPTGETGKAFWKKVYKKAYEQYGTTKIPVDTFNKVWIMPQKAEVYAQGDRAFVVDAKLKVMLETDYLALENSVERIADSEAENLSAKPYTLNAKNDFSKEIIREIILPELEKEVNEGKNFAQLRQIYNTIILSYWFKNNLKNSILRSEEHTSELQSHSFISYAVFCLKKKNITYT